MVFLQLIIDLLASIVVLISCTTVFLFTVVIENKIKQKKQLYRDQVVPHPLSLLEVWGCGLHSVSSLFISMSVNLFVRQYGLLIARTITLPVTFDMC